MTNEQSYIFIAGGFVVCVLCQWLGWRLKLPAILFLLPAGVTVGPILQLVEPEQLMGQLFFPFVSLSVAIILFEGSVSLKFKEILGLGSVVRNMLTVGLLTTWLVTTAATRLLTGFGWDIAFLFGAITVVTGPTVIAPLLRTVRPTSRISQILRWEGIVIDPIGASLAVLVYEFIISESTQQAWEQTVLTFFLIVGVGFCIGAAAGYCFGLVLRNRLIPEFLHNVTTLALIFSTFVLANHIQLESGLVTVTVFGMWLANMRGVELDEIIKFKENLSILLISLLFMMLSARLDVDELKEIGWIAFYLFVVVQFLARPLNVFVSSLGSNLTPVERGFLAWIAPRGIVAAAISSLFAIKLTQLGFDEARFLVPLTFAIIIGTVLLQSVTALPLARCLGVAEPEPHGFMIIGANFVARTIGAALARHGVRVLLVDTDWEKIELARRQGLEVYHGSPLSAEADQKMNLAGIGRLLALSRHESVNMAATLRYRHEFGRDHVYSIATDEDTPFAPSTQSLQKHSLPLFGRQLTYHYLASICLQDNPIKTAILTTELDYKTFCSRHGDTRIELFFLDLKKRIHISTGENIITPETGWTITFIERENNEDSAP